MSRYAPNISLITRVRFQTGAKRFSLLQNVRFSVGTYLAFHSVDSGVLSLAIERPVREVDHSIPSGVEILLLPVMATSKLLL
jgi:hypothetical protein